MSTAPSVQRFFDRFPAAYSNYAGTPLYHLTHSRYLPGIQADGLRPHPTLFPETQGAFLVDILRRYGSGHPGDSDYVQRRILDPRTVYLSTSQPDMQGSLAYGVPERLMLLMRGMASLALKASLTDGERQFAAAALEGHRQALTENNPAIVGLCVDPLAPSVANSRFGTLDLDSVPDAETALDIARYVDDVDVNNIAVQGRISPEYITEFGRTPIDAERALQGVYAEAGWAASIR
jgi:hypothetical protein